MIQSKPFMLTEVKFGTKFKLKGDNRVYRVEWFDENFMWYCLDRERKNAAEHKVSFEEASKIEIEPVFFEVVQ